MMFCVDHALNASIIRTVFLDRDGVLNRKAREGECIARWDVFHPLPDIEVAIRLLNTANLPVYVVTNQRGVALGLYSADDVELLHMRILEELRSLGARVEDFFFCPHDKEECNCRKPLTGLFEQAKDLHPEIDFKSSLMVGDSLSDIEAGRRLGMQTIFIDSDAQRQNKGCAEARALAGAVAASLLEAVQLVVGQPLDAQHPSS